jgi:hypothetical protein
MLTDALIVGGILTVGGLLAWAFIYAAGHANYDIHGDDSSDHELALSAARGTTT